jgi:phosphatidyl-myo-inositol alpha-mannosyltransferase
MRVAMVSPYSWSYAGGVNSHVRELAACFRTLGHEVDVLAPADPAGRVSSLLHAGAGSQQPGSREPEAADRLVSLGRTVGIPANGAVSNLSLSPLAVVRLIRRLKAGAYDVVHVHEPEAPVVAWAALDCCPLDVPLVGTFHTYNEHRFSHAVGTALGVRRVLNRLRVRIAVSEPAAWTARRFFGGRYRVIPNGVHLDVPFDGLDAALDPADGHPIDVIDLTHGRGELRIVFVGQPVTRKGLPVLLRAFETLREQVPALLTLVGPSEDDVASVLLDRRGVTALGRVGDSRKRSELLRADVLCAPSLGGESFGMVLTEAFAAGLPVVASDIPGYRTVVRPGADGLLVPAGDVPALAEALLRMSDQPAVRGAMGRRAAQRAQQFAWPEVASRVMEAYVEAVATPAPAGLGQRAAVRIGVKPADLKPRQPARKLPSLQPAHSGETGPLRSRLRTFLSIGITAVAAAVAVVAIRHIGVGRVTSALSRVSPGWIILALVVMAASMTLRALSWHATLRAALPGSIRFTYAMRGLFIGVLVSSTLPANLGEPTRAFVVARRTPHPWKSLPVVAGTMVSQSVLNVVAVVALGVATIGSVTALRPYRVLLLAGLALVVALLLLLILFPKLLNRPHLGTRARKLGEISSAIRDGVAVLHRPDVAVVTIGAQAGAWALQLLSVYVLLIGMHLDSQTGLLAAAAVLFAVNVTMLFPITPGDLGVFQAAVATVLHSGWNVSYGRGVAFAVVLQAIELATAILMGGPALVVEGLSLRQIVRRPRPIPDLPVPPTEQTTRTSRPSSSTARR